MFQGIKQIPNEFIITTFDDLILDKFPSNSEVIGFIKNGYVTDDSVVKLSRSSNILKVNDHLTGINETRYKHSLVFTLIKTNLLVNLLSKASVEQANAWEYETKNWADIYICYEYLIVSAKYYNLVVKGKVNFIAAFECYIQYGVSSFLRLKRKKMRFDLCIKHKVKELLGQALRILLDEMIHFELMMFIFYLSALYALHSILFFKRSFNVLSNSKYFIELFNTSIYGFFKFIISGLFSGDENLKFKNFSLKFFWLYGVSHAFLCMLFPVVIFVGGELSELRAALMGG